MRLRIVHSRMSEYQIRVQNGPQFTAPAGQKLVLAIEEHGVDISHRCGGNARCTSCRVKFVSDEPPMGPTEQASLDEDGVLGQFRLSCQVRIDRDMEVEVLQPVSSAPWEDAGVEVEP